MLPTLLCLSSALQAAALGEVTVHSALGQKLDAEIEIVALSAAESETLAVRPATAEAFAEANIDITPAIRSLRFAIEKKGQRTVVHITSEQTLNDPFITMLFELESDGNRMMRQYALLLDPATVEAAPQAGTDVQTAAPAVAEAIAPAPASAAAVENPAAETPDYTHTVQRGETLRRIAAPLRAAANAQLEQVLVALQRANPAAFFDKNMNRVKTGSVLKLPDADAIQSVDAAAARKLVLAQTADFERYRNGLAQQARSEAAAEAENADQNHSSSGKIGVQVVEPGAAGAPKDKLVLSAAGAPSEKAAAAANLDKIASDKAAAEAQERIASLEKNVSDMQQLLEMKNKALADMQNKPAPVVTPPAPVVKAEPKLEAKPEVRTEAKPAATPAWKRVARQVRAYLRDPLALPIGGALLAALVALILLRARRRRQSLEVKDQAEAAEPAAKSTTLFDIAGGRHVDTSNSVFHSNFVPSVSQLDTNEVDAFAEADVYIAYGRDEQAEEILQDALRTHPERNALRVKLLEIYAARKDVKKFGKLAADLYGITHGSGEEWMQAAQLGQMLEPANLLYSAARRSEAPEGRVEPSLKLVGGDFDLSGISLELEPSAASDDPATQALHTKLDLALACQEIGDKDGARELLSEVAGSGNSKLSSQAKSLLRQLA
jgi:pilus assembly protein FimV